MYLHIPTNRWLSKFCLHVALNKFCWNKTISICRQGLTWPERIKPDIELVPLLAFIWSIGLGWKTFPRRRWDRDASSGSWKTNAYWAPGDCAQPCFRMTGSGVSSVQCTLSKKNEELQQVSSKARGEWRQSWGRNVAARIWQRSQVTSVETQPGVMPPMLRLLRHAASADCIGLKCRPHEAWPSNESAKASLGRWGRAKQRAAESQGKWEKQGRLWKAVLDFLEGRWGSQLGRQQNRGTQRKIILRSPDFAIKI